MLPGFSSIFNLRRIKSDTLVPVIGEWNCYFSTGSPKTYAEAILSFCWNLSFEHILEQVKATENEIVSLMFYKYRKTVETSPHLQVGIIFFTISKGDRTVKDKSTKRGRCFKYSNLPSPTVVYPDWRSRLLLHLFKHILRPFYVPSLNQKASTAQ